MFENESQQNMLDDNTGETTTAVESAQDTMELFLSSADVHAVYAEPVLHGEHLIIPAAEILSAAGFGYGSGKGDDGESKGSGSGGGGGGRVFSRPVAVVVSSRDGVVVKPVFDFTKIALAGITAFGFMIATLARMQHPPRIED
jgi:uncharacterized spore protein YtfJ